MAFLSGVFKSSLYLLGKDSSTFPYTLGDRITTYNHPFWSLHSGTKKQDGSFVSVFVFDCNKNRDRIQLARNAFKRFRTLRHPDLLNYLHGIENENTIMIVTDPVVPLSTQLEQTLDQNIVLWGLYKIANAIKFLNNDCTLIHGNIRIATIFTNKAGEWKLGGLELLSSMKEECPMILTFGGLVPDALKYAPPEIKKSNWTSVKDIPVAAVDSYQLGCLIYETYNLRFDNSDQLQQPNKIPTSMRSAYLSLLEPSLQSRSNADLFLENGSTSKKNGYFDVDFIHINLFLENISIKDQGEKEPFFRKLDLLVAHFPNEFAMYKILPELINAFEFGSGSGGSAKALNTILKIGEHLPEHEFSKTLVTPILRMFASPDRAIRVSLLENMAKFIDHIPDKVVCSQVFPQVATGFTDTMPILREQSLKASLLLVPKLSERIINFDLLKHLAKLQLDQEPGIRTNTIICLGKLAKSFSDATRKNILIVAFTRGLRDGFHHARIAALMALNATSEYYEPEAIALRIVPAISCVLLDNEKSVRVQAFKTITSFITRLEQVAEGMTDTALMVPTTMTNQDNLNQPTKSPTNSTIFVPGMSMLGGATKGLTEWAVSSITRFGTSSDEIEPQTTRTPGSNSAEDASMTHSVHEESTLLSDGMQGDTSTAHGKDEMGNDWEPMNPVSQQQHPIMMEPISSTLIPSDNNPISLVSSFGLPVPPSSTCRKGLARTSMKLTSHASSLADTLQLDGAYTPPLTPTVPTSSPTSSGGGGSMTPMPTNERKVELERKREQRRQYMAELREKKKSGIGAKKTSVV